MTGKPWMKAALAAAGLLALAPAAQAQEGQAIKLVCGGIGVDESAKMRAEISSHSLTILYSTPDGSYLTGVHTRVDDPLKDRSAESECGPVGQVDVSEPGRYRVTATFTGQTRSQWFDLKPGGGARTVMSWRE